MIEFNMTLFEKLKIIYKKFVLLLTGEFILSFFVTIYLILPLVNCIRSLFLIQLEISFFYYLFSFLFFFGFF